MTFNQPTKTFLLGLSLSGLILISFFAGGLADRVFVLKPLDYLAGERLGRWSFTPSTGSTLTPSSGVATSYNLPDVAEQTSRSVVTVAIKKEQPVMQRLDLGIFGLQRLQPSGEVQQIQQDIGTGFVVDDSGLIVTNRHVVGDTQASYSVFDRDNQEYQVTRIYRDPTHDLAILKIDNSQLPALQLGNSDQLRVGESVFAIGTALGEFRHTVTTGVVSGLGRGIEAGDALSGVFESLEGVIQTDAAINPGNSGGPLLNVMGEVIGVNVAVSANGQNIGFALPISLVKSSLDNFNKTGQFDRPYLGVQYRNLTQQSAVLNSVPQGAYLVQVVPGSPAAQAGLQVGDIVTEFNGEKVLDQELADLINQHKIGDTVSLTYWRDQKTVTLELTLQARPAE